MSSESFALTLQNCTVPVAVLGEAGGALQKLDIDIVDGQIAALRPVGSKPASGAVRDLDGGLVLPCLADIHTHLDKGHIWPRTANPDGTWFGALMAVMGDRESRWAAQDVERRMDFALRCAYAHGTAAIRTHLDAAPPQHEISFAVFETMRERWADRVELQAVALVGPDTLLDPAALDAVAQQAKRSGGILGGSIAVHPEARAAIFAAVQKAGELGLDLDLHTDETLAPESSALRHLADAVLETGFQGRALAGHCCVLSVQEDPVWRRTIDRVAEAGISVVSLPMCNIFLQDRAAPRTPRYRGVTLVNELKAAGVKVALASDNTRDPFYAYGDLDMIEVFRESVRIAHLDYPQDSAWTWARAASADACDITGFDYRGMIREGAPADLILLRARSWTELMSRPQSDRIVLRAGRPIDSTLPDYRELDELME